MRMNERTRNNLSTTALAAATGLFVSTGIQVGFARNLGVPTVPNDITMTSSEANELPGLAARDWAAGTSILFAGIGLAAIFGRADRRMVHNLISAILFLTLLPIAIAYRKGTMPPGADWIVMHHCISGVLQLVARPPKRAVDGP
ncbi:MAG: hypothetical protein KDB72_18860 [Mycobacterium sp.]|nr:hypothetical protein [Mycobacterium sp.]